MPYAQNASSGFALRTYLLRADWKITCIMNSRVIWPPRGRPVGGGGGNRYAMENCGNDPENFLDFFLEIFLAGPGVEKPVRFIPPERCLTRKTPRRVLRYALTGIRTDGKDLYKIE